MTTKFICKRGDVQSVIISVYMSKLKRTSCEPDHQKLAVPRCRGHSAEIRTYNSRCAPRLPQPRAEEN